MFLKKAIVHTIEEESMTLKDLLEHLDLYLDVHEQHEIINDVYNLIAQGVLCYKGNKLKKL